MAMKEVRAVLADLDRRVADAVPAASAAEALRLVYGLGTVTPIKAMKRGTRKAIADGSLADRILGILREAKAPVAKKVIVAGAGARELDVVLTIKELVADGRIRKTGVRAGTKYALAKGGKK